MKLIIEINLDGAAFEDDLPGAVEYALGQADGKLRSHFSPVDYDLDLDDMLLDINGNPCGTVRVVAD